MLVSRSDFIALMRVLRQNLKQWAMIRRPLFERKPEHLASSIDLAWVNVVSSGRTLSLNSLLHGLDLSNCRDDISLATSLRSFIPAYKACRSPKINLDLRVEALIGRIAAGQSTLLSPRSTKTVFSWHAKPQYDTYWEMLRTIFACLATSRKPLSIWVSRRWTRPYPCSLWLMKIWHQINEQLPTNRTTCQCQAFNPLL